MSDISGGETPAKYKNKRVLTKTVGTLLFLRKKQTSGKSFQQLLIKLLKSGQKWLTLFFNIIIIKLYLRKEGKQL